MDHHVTLLLVMTKVYSPSLRAKRGNPGSITNTMDSCTNFWPILSLTFATAGNIVWQTEPNDCNRISPSMTQQRKPYGSSAENFWNPSI